MSSHSTPEGMMHLKKMTNQRETRTTDPRQPKPCKTCGKVLDPAKYPTWSTAMWEKRKFCSRECSRGRPKVEAITAEGLPVETGVCAAGCGNDLWQEQMERGERFCWRCQDTGIGRVLEFKRKRDGYHVKENGASA